jgi:cell division protein FtsZ
VRIARAKLRAPPSPRRCWNRPIEGATGILLNITGLDRSRPLRGQRGGGVVTSAADQNANVIFGAVIDDSQRTRCG